MGRTGCGKSDCSQKQPIVYTSSQDPYKWKRSARSLACWLVALLVLIAGLLSPSVAHAQDERATVRIDGRALFRVGPIDGVDAESRARRIEQRISTLLQSPAAITPARIEAEGPNRQIIVSGVTVVTVTPEDAEDNLFEDVDALAEQWARTLNDALQRARERRQSPWGVFVAEVRGSVENAFGNVFESLITIVPRALAALLVICLFWMVAHIVRWLVTNTLCRLLTERTLQNLIKQVAYYAVWVLGLVVAVDALGFDPQAVATGLGLTGLALGFALRDIISNFVSGLLILTMRPFRIGDQIIVGETEGNVERIELRATQILTYDGRRVLVPNADVFTSIVTNNTASPMRRADIHFHVSYDVDLQKVVSVVREAAQRAPGVLETPPVNVLVRELEPDGVMIEVRVWADSRRSDFLATMSAVRQAIVNAAKQAAINLPDPFVRNLVPRDPQQWRTALGTAEYKDEHVR